MRKNAATGTPIWSTIPRRASIKFRYRPKFYRITKLSGRTLARPSDYLCIDITGKSNKCCKKPKNLSYRRINYKRVEKEWIGRCG